jgi:hypothetical protein
LDPISKENQCFVKLNPKRGIGYLKMAVKQHESVWAMIQLGNIYAQGFRSIERNPTEAEKWYRKAAHYGTHPHFCCYILFVPVVVSLFFVQNQKLRNKFSFDSIQFVFLFVCLFR